MSGLVVWLTGKPSSGKSTLARRLWAELRVDRAVVCLLDGDEIRAALVPPHGYDPASRDDFYQTLGNLAALIARQGLIVLVAATAHRRVHRERARAAAPDFIEVYVRATQTELEARDAKGLYAAVREGRLKGVPGADVEYEEPVQPELTSEGGEADLGALLAAIRRKLP